MKITKASNNDSLDIFQWRNDPLTRQNSVNTSTVSLKDHNQWFNEVLNSRNTELLIGIENSIKVGVCRFCLNNLSNSVEVSINLNPLMRGKRISKKLLEESINYYLKNNKVMLTATIRINNIPSIKIFEELNFIKTKSTDSFNYYERNF